MNLLDVKGVIPVDGIINNDDDMMQGSFAFQLSKILKLAEKYKEMYFVADIDPHSSIYRKGKWLKLTDSDYITADII